MADEKLPLSFRQRRTPTRNQKRSKRWRKLYPGYHFEGTSWVIVEGPWRKLKRAGSVSWVTVECSKQHGGCGRVHDRKLDAIIQGISSGCIHCFHQRQRQKREQAQRQASTEAVKTHNSSS